MPLWHVSLHVCSHHHLLFRSLTFVSAISLQFSSPATPMTASARVANMNTAGRLTRHIALRVSPRTGHVPLALTFKCSPRRLSAVISLQLRTLAIGSIGLTLFPRARIRFFCEDQANGNSALLLLPSPLALASPWPMLMLGVLRQTADR